MTTTTKDKHRKVTVTAETLHRLVLDRDALLEAHKMNANSLAVVLGHVKDKDVRAVIESCIEGSVAAIAQARPR